MRVLMLGLVSSILALEPAGAAQVTAAQDKAIALGFRIIREHRLVEKNYLPCISLMLEDEDVRRVAKIAVRENHKPHPPRCAGAPETAPRLFSLEIDMRSGKAKWDRFSDENPGMEMRAVPKKREGEGIRYRDRKTP